MRIDQLTQLAKAFRKAFETVGRKQQFGKLPFFPDDCCSWASLFIGTFLRDEYDLCPKKFLSAIHKSGANHEWVVLNGIIIDITADQFDDFEGSVFVGLRSEWHEKLEGGELSNYPALSEYDKLAMEKEKNISSIYKEISSKALEYFHDFTRKT